MYMNYEIMFAVYNVSSIIELYFSCEALNLKW